MSLKEQLAEYRAGWYQRVPAERQAMMQRHIDQLRSGAIAQTMLKVGDRAPTIVLGNAKGESVDVGKLLAKGPVIVAFYRGGWCPFCNIELKAFQDVLPEIAAAGASLVAISPEKPDDTLSTAEKNALTFEVLSDVGQKVGRAFGLVYEFTEELKSVYQGFKLDIPARNGTPGEWALPVSATYVIDRDGTIIYAYTDADYRDRADPRDVLESLTRKRAAADSRSGRPRAMVRTILLLVIGLLAAPTAGRAADAVSFAASDQVQVFGDYYSAGARAKPLILLFHQAGSNRAEYATIGPMLAALGFNALAIDQRSGGTLWGHANETVEHRGGSAGYDEALRDLEAAIAWAKSSNQSGPIYAWGSSYSAALVFLLAARHPEEIKAVLAFSPGEYLRDRQGVRHAAAQLSMPIFVTSAKDSEEIAQAAAILAAARSRDKVQFVPRLDGVHGASTLRPDRNPKGAEENWMAVRAFLSRVAP